MHKIDINNQQSHDYSTRKFTTINDSKLIVILSEYDFQYDCINGLRGYGIDILFIPESIDLEKYPKANAILRGGLVKGGKIKRF